jgi:hypothetical protein
MKLFNNMKLFSVAIGEKYELEAGRLKSSVSNDIEVFTKLNSKYVQVNEDPLINGLWHKCNFANYIDEAEGAVVFMDADMFTLTENPFETFNIKEDTDFAYVPYQGKWHFPDIIRQEAFNHHGHKINSGFMYFKNLEIAKDICTKWAEEFLKRPLHWIKNEYDEYALMIALMDMNYKVELLDVKWNDWELGTEEEIKSSNSIFFQSHDFLNIDLK